MRYPPVVLAVWLTIMLPMDCLTLDVACAARAWLRGRDTPAGPGGYRCGGRRSAVAGWVVVGRRLRVCGAAATGGAGWRFPGVRAGTVVGGGTGWIFRSR